MNDYRSDQGDYDLDQLTAIFRLLADKTRLTILVMLSGGEKNVTTLCKDLALPQPTVSHHLGLLRASKAILNRRAGKQVFYCLNGQVNRHHSALGILLEKYHLSITPSSMDKAIPLAS